MTSTKGGRPAESVPSVSRRKHAPRNSPKPGGKRDVVDAGTPDLSKKSGRAKKTSGTSSVDTRAEHTVSTHKTSDESTFRGELCRVLFHLLFVLMCIFGTVCLFEYSMLQYIEWEPPNREEPRLKAYRGAAFITKDFDCSILARRCFMMKRNMQKCMTTALVCVTMLRPDMFPTALPFKQHYYVNVRHISSTVNEVGKKQEAFNTFHDKIKRAHILSRLSEYNDLFVKPFPNSKGMPRDNQLFFIPWEILDLQDKYKDDFDYIDLNLDDTPDCIQPKVNTDRGRRDWISSMSWPLRDFKEPPHSFYRWNRDTVQRTSHFRVDGVPGFTGAFMKKIIDVATVIMETEMSHSHRDMHTFTDDTLLLIYRHVLIYALRNPYLMLFDESAWQERTKAFDPEEIMQFDDLDKIVTLTGASSSLSFIFGAHSTGVGTKIPETLVLTISESKAKLGGMEFDLNAPIRISSGLINVEIASSAQGERAFHSNIITALRIMLRLRINPDKPNLNYVLHIPMAFFSMAEKKMVFDDYNIKTTLRNQLCSVVTRCATPFDQASIDWQTRFNGTTAIMYNIDKEIRSRIDETQDKRNYAVGY